MRTMLLISLRIRNIKGIGLTHLLPPHIINSIEKARESFFASERTETLTLNVMTSKKFVKALF